MDAAIALAVVLVIAVAGLSLAMQTQHPANSGSRIRRPPMPNWRAPTPDAPSRPPSRARKVKEPAPEPVVEDVTAALKATGPKGPELLRSGIPAKARVVSIVDERVVGPVTRSRLTLAISPPGEGEFEVSLRHAFPTAAERAAVRIGGTIAVRYDQDNHRKVLLDPGPATGSDRESGEEPGDAASGDNPAPPP